MKAMVTSHFSVEEFACHDGTPYPADWIEERLRPLCEMLEEIRAGWSRRVEVLSGYRTVGWNLKVGGARESQHLAGRAADIRTSAANAWEMHDQVLRLYRNEKLPRLGGLGLYPHFIHVDIRSRVEGNLTRWTGKGIG